MKDTPIVLEVTVPNGSIIAHIGKGSVITPEILATADKYLKQFTADKQAITEVSIKFLQQKTERFFMFSAAFSLGSIQGCMQDFGRMLDNYPSKTELQEEVRRTHQSATEIVILGLTEMTKEEYSTYWSL